MTDKGQLDTSVDNLSEEELMKKIEAVKKEPAVSTIPEPSEKPDEPAQPTKQQPAPTKKGQADPIEWARKKGLMSETDIAKSYQDLEKEFHKKNVELKRVKAESVSQPQVEPQTPPPPIYNQPQPVQAPSFQSKKDAIRFYAEKFGINEDDVERLAPFMIEISNMAVQTAKADVDRRFGELDKKSRVSERTEDRLSILQDSSIKNPQVRLMVLNEVHRVLKDDPSILERERRPYTYAYKEAQVNVARQFLEGGVSPTDPGSSLGLPNVPPPTGGSMGGGQSSGDSEQVSYSLNQFDKLSLEKQEEVLTALGAMPRGE